MPYQYSLAYLFKHYDRIDLIFVSHFKKILIYDQKLTKKIKPFPNVLVHIALQVLYSGDDASLCSIT